MLDEAFLTRLDEMKLRIRGPMSGGAGGLRRSRALGSSVEFSDFRQYAPGDDLRRVDWNAYARFDKMFLKLFMEEQEASVSIMLDASASMALDGKWDAATSAAQALCYLALRGGDRVTLYALAGAKCRSSRPLSGRQSMPDASAFISAIAPGGETQLDASLRDARLPAGRGQCVLISDLLSEAGYETGLRSLGYRKQEAAVVHVLGAGELAPDFEGPLTLRDSETDEALEINCDYQTLCGYRAALKAFLQSAEAACSRLGAPYALLDAREDFTKTALRAMAVAGLIC